MSHITKVKTHLKDGVILRKALTKMGYQIEECDLRQTWKAEGLEFVARKAKISIGFKQSGGKPSAYEMLADWDAVPAKGKDVINAVYQVYSQEKIMDMARVKGYSLTRNRMNEKGQIEMVLRKMG